METSTKILFLCFDLSKTFSIFLSQVAGLPVYPRNGCATDDHISHHPFFFSFPRFFHLEHHHIQYPLAGLPAASPRKFADPAVENLIYFVRLATLCHSRSKAKVALFPLKSLLRSYCLLLFAVVSYIRY